MINTRIYKVLTSLDKPMLNRFLKFIHSPYHNVNNKISQLAELVIEAIKAEKELPSKQHLWNIIINKGKYDDLKFRKLCNDTLERFENFLVYENMESNKLLKSNLLLESIKNYNLQILIEKNIARSNKLFEREIDQSSEFYIQKYLYEKTIQSFKSNDEIKANIKEYLANPNFKISSKFLDVFYAIEKLRFAADTITWSTTYQTNFDVDLGHTFDVIDVHDLEEYPAVKIYLYMYKILSNENDFENYYVLKAFTYENIDHFPRDEQREIMDALLSFCVKQINKGNSDFLTEIMELHEWGIKTGISLVNNMLSSTSFRNYIVSGLRAGEFDRVENFILEKSELLEESKRENAINFNLARVSIYKKQYEKVIEYLNNVSYDDVVYNLNSKIYLLLAYYELDETMALESQLETFQTFVRRQKSIQESVKKLYLNFVKYLKKIYRVNPRDKIAIEKIREALENEKTIINKSWLQEKIDELL